MVIVRLATMIEGSYCPVSIDGSVKHKDVKRSSRGLYIRINNKTLYERDLPLGEDVIL